MKGLMCLFYFYLFGLMNNILHIRTVHKTASPADEGSSAYYQPRGVENNLNSLTFCNYIIMSFFL